MNLKKLEEKCGIVALYANRFNRSLPLALLAAGGIQHRGQQGAGLAYQSETGLKTYKDKGLLQEIFTKKVIRKLNKPSRWIIFHCRYGTHGDYQHTNLQPCVTTSSEGEKVAVAHNGEFVDLDRLKKFVSKTKKDTSDTLLFTQLLALEKGSSWDEKLINSLKKVKGAYSLLIGVKDSLYVARDQFGIRPLVLGKIDHGFIIASETHALDKVHATIIREIKKGEVVKFSNNKIIVLKKESKSHHHFCDFEWAYFSRPDSIYPTYDKEKETKFPKKWLSFTEFRERCGRILAQEVKIPHASFIVGIPDSGVYIAIGYSNEARIPFRQVIVRDHFDPNGLQRLFMRDDQMKKIGKKVLGKLSLTPDGRIWKNAIVVIGDDSIVRGNVSANITKAVFSQGAKEVHWVIGLPPVAYTCHLGVSMRAKEELIAARLNSDCKKIARAIGATSVNYISFKGFVKAKNTLYKKQTEGNCREIFLQNNGCGGCLTGIYPVGKDGKIWHGKKRLAILIGGGSRLPAIYHYVKNDNNQFEIAVVVSYKRRSAKIAWAKKRGIPAIYHRFIDYKDHGKSKEQYNHDLINLLQKYNVDWVFGVGWHIIWTENFLKAFNNRVLNTHPFPLPDGPAKFIPYNGKSIPVLRGVDVLRHAWEKKLPITGACVHFAKKTVDIGPVLIRDVLPIKKEETFKQLEKRHCQFEGKVLVKALKLLSENEVKIINDRVVLKPSPS